MEYKVVTLTEARAGLSKLTKLARDGGMVVVITKHGTPVAQITPLERPRKPIDINALRKLSTNMPTQTESAGVFMRKLREYPHY